MTPQTATTVTAQGVDAVEVLKVSATVEKVDLGSRKVTLLFENGKKKTYKVDKSVQNLDQVKVGEQPEDFLYRGTCHPRRKIQ